MYKCRFGYEVQPNLHLHAYFFMCKRIILHQVSHSVQSMKSIHSTQLRIARGFAHFPRTVVYWTKLLVSQGENDVVVDVQALDGSMEYSLCTGAVTQFDPSGDCVDVLMLKQEREPDDGEEFFQPAKKPKWKDDR